MWCSRVPGEHPAGGGVQAEPGEQGDHRQPSQDPGGAGGSAAEAHLLHPAEVQHGLAHRRRRHAGGHRSAEPSDSAVPNHHPSSADLRPSPSTSPSPATAALQSVLPASELGAFMALPKKDKELQLNELAMLVTGIRLFNRAGGRGQDEADLSQLGRWKKTQQITAAILGQPERQVMTNELL